MKSINRQTFGRVNNPGINRNRIIIENKTTATTSKFHIFLKVFSIYCMCTYYQELSIHIENAFINAVVQAIKCLPNYGKLTEYCMLKIWQSMFQQRIYFLVSAYKKIP